MRRTPHILPEFRRHLIVLINSLMLTLLTLGSSQAQAEIHFAGGTLGTFSVSSGGTSTYTIDLDVPPGTAGMEPSLGLSYSSRSGNGLLGMGWSLAGLSSIYRCPQNIAQDGGIQAVQYDTRDKFCIDGKRLIRITPEVYAAGSLGGGIVDVFNVPPTTIEYKTEIASYAKIISYGTTIGEDPTKFKVWTKDGAMVEYGFTADSRIEAQGKSEVRIWAVNKVSDRVGNYYTVSYFEDNAAGVYRVTQMDYTGNTDTGMLPNASVRFEYEARTENIIRYVAGSKIQIPQRLKRIKTYSEETLVKEYRLAYDYGAVTDRSRLTQLEECAADGVCKLASRFTFTNLDSTWKVTGNLGSFSPAQGYGYANNNRTPVITGDWNGDGRTDFARMGYGADVSFRTSTGTGWANYSGLPSLVPARPLRSQFRNVIAWLVAEERYANNFKNPIVITGDWNGDGYSDVGRVSKTGMVFHTSNKGSGWANYAALDTFSPAQGFASNNVNPIITGDWNGDGRTDIARVGSSAVHFRVSTGTGWASYGNMALFSPAQGFTNNNKFPILTGDWNGDGRTDIARVNGSGVVFQVSTGTGWVAYAGLNTLSPGQGFVNSNTHPMITGDWNGDGRTDIARVDGTGVSIRISTGAGWATYKKLEAFSPAQGFANNNTYPIMTGDWNGDGRTDIARVSGSGVVYFLAKGNGWSNNYKGINNFSPAQGFVNNTVYPLITGDWNGDGRPDIGRVTGSGVSFYKTTEKAHDKIQSFKDGHGNNINVSYKPITDTSVYTKANTAVYPLIDIQNARNVVSSVNRENGIGGLYTLNYKYVGAKVDVRGRGLGFRTVKVTDMQTDIATKTTYNQVWPTSGLVERMTKKIVADNILIEDTNNTYQVIPLLRNQVAVHSKTVDKTNYKLNGIEVTSKLTTNSYDELGNVTETVVDSKDGYQQTTTSTYINDLTNWNIGLVSTTDATNATPSAGTQTRQTAFGYEPVTGLLVAQTLEPNHASLRLTTAYTLDAYGNRTGITLDGPGITARTNTVIYDARGQFLISASNALDHIASATFDPLFGNVLSQTGVNGLTTTWEYDTLGRQTKETRPDGVITTTVYNLCTVDCEDDYKLDITTQSTGGVPTTVYYDKLGREFLTRTHGFDNRIIEKRTIYNALGHVELVTEPYYDGDPVYHSNYEYDILGRQTLVFKPDDSTVDTIYDGLMTIIINSLGQFNVKLTDSQGQLIVSVDNDNGNNSYAYDPFGNLSQVIDPLGNTIDIDYNIRGQKTGISDPNMGSWTYSYDALEQLITQINAKGQTSINQYDLLGRIVQRTEVEGISTWVYDTGDMAIGKLTQNTAPNGSTQTHSFDNLGRPSNTTSTVKGVALTQTLGYDALSRIDTVTYPSGFTTQNGYNAQGYLSQIKNRADNIVYWQAEAYDARGQMLQETLGNGITTNRTYDEQTGRITAIMSDSANSRIQDLMYAHDTLGNLMLRQDWIQGNTESFEYDTLNRLSGTQLNDGSLQETRYDEIGNITFKTGVGSYLYQKTGNAGSSAVTQVTLGTKVINYGYDKNGNRTSGDGKTLAYTSFNKPASILSGATTSTYNYEADRTRSSKVSVKDGITQTTLYLDKMYEQVTSSKDNIIEQKHYIGAGTGTVIYTQRSNNVNDTRYLHKDHLGSTDAITDESGNRIEQVSFDPWGARRESNWTATATASATPVSLTTRGYTGHEMDDEIGLINMNARMYDQKLGRFLQPDSIVQFADSTQGFNRYTYLSNNPLNATDPTGNRDESRERENYRDDYRDDEPNYYYYDKRASRFVPIVVRDRPRGEGSREEQERSDDRDDRYDDIIDSKEIAGDIAKYFRGKNVYLELAPPNGPQLVAVGDNYKITKDPKIEKWIAAYNDRFDGSWIDRNNKLISEVGLTVIGGGGAALGLVRFVKWAAVGRKGANTSTWEAIEVSILIVGSVVGYGDRVNDTSKAQKGGGRRTDVKVARERLDRSKQKLSKAGTERRPSSRGGRGVIGIIRYMWKQ